jgi:hypothetical protein
MIMKINFQSFNRFINVKVQINGTVDKLEL